MLGFKTLAQEDSVYVKEIRTYTRYIDSLFENDSRQRKVIQSVSEGKTSVTRAINGNEETQSYSGGFSRYVIENTKGDTVYRINVNDNIEKYLVQTFYYKSNKPVFASIQLQDLENGKKVIYQREEFYRDGKLISSTSTSDLDEKYKWRIDFSALWNADFIFQEYLDEKAFMELK